jgi:hypothetical protein
MIKEKEKEKIYQLVLPSNDVRNLCSSPSIIYPLVDACLSNSILHKKKYNI